MDEPELRQRELGRRAVRGSPAAVQVEGQGADREGIVARNGAGIGEAGFLPVLEDKLDPLAEDRIAARFLHVVDRTADQRRFLVDLLAQDGQENDGEVGPGGAQDRKSTRLNYSH